MQQQNKDMPSIELWNVSQKMYVKENNHTVVCHYVVNIWSQCSHIYRDGIIQQHILHSVLCVNPTSPDITCVVSCYEHIIGRRIR